MSDPRIHAALAAHLNAMLPTLPTAWPNSKFTPPTAAPYQEAWLMPARNRNRNIGKAALHSGIYQVNLCYPAANGSTTVEQRAKLVQDHFSAATTVLTNGGITVRITRKPSIAAQPLERPGFYVLPVSIEYESIF